MVSVEVIQGPDKGRAYPVPGTEAVIGRQSENLPLTDGTVSRQHARLSQRDSNWYIEDLGSVNGTYLNGVRVNRPVRLHLGDQIRCGTTLLVFGTGGVGNVAPPLDINENGQFIEAAIMATLPANDDSVIIPTPEAGAAAIDNLRILYNLTTTLSSIFNLDHLVRRTLEAVVEVVPADRGFILLVGPEGQLVPKASVDRTEARNGRAPADNMPISRTIINEVMAKHIGVISSNAMRDKRFSSGKSVHDYGIRSALCVPIKGRSKILGVIHLDSSMADRTYSTEQLRLLTAIGLQTGLAIENVRLYEAAVRGERLAAMGETVAVLSHHIKNILQALGGGVDVVEMALQKNDLGRVKSSWPLVRRSLDRVNAVILNMLAFSKPRQPLLETINVNHIVQECMDLIGPQADERGVAIINDLGDLPPIPADAAGLNQAVMNLLANAIDAVKDKTGAITVSTEFDPLLRNVILKVVDNGIGIEPDQLPHIFEPFHSSKGQKGTGLGLAVTKKVVEEHGGRIAVQSSPNAGTTFTVTLAMHPGALRSSAETLSS